MRGFWRKARTLIAVYFAYMLEYRGEIFFWMLSGITPFFFMSAWTVAARRGLTEYGADDYARYFFAVFVARQLGIVWVHWNMSEDVRSGKYSFRLLRPLNPLWCYLADHLGERGVRLPMLAAVGLVFALLYPQALAWPGAERAALGLLAAGLAFGVNFFASYVVGLLALWLEDATALYNLWYAAMLFFSGMMAPLGLYPEPVRQVLLWTPFPHLVYLPAALWSGLEAEVGRGLGTLLAWNLFFFALGRLLWRWGRRCYSAMGA
ncbi:ABC transporter permease [Oceanithermus sp.]